MLGQRLCAVLPLLCCPRCGAPFALDEHSLICENRHCYDLSRRGYVNLAPGHDQSAEKYDAELFAARAKVLEGGFYAPVLEAVCGLLSERFRDRPFTLLDVGCGEGYYARAIAARFPAVTAIGVDLSRDAVAQAARTPSAAHWFVADLKRLPLRDGAAQVVLDVLTPADYASFARVLGQDGVLIKVVPEQDYLTEVRHAIAPYLRGGADYDNAAVLTHLSRHARIEKELCIRKAFPLTPEQSRAFLRMTPMTFSVPQEALDSITLSQITIHMRVLCCRLR